MIFTRLSLKNFKSYDDAEIKFNEGISVIVGENATFTVDEGAEYNNFIA